MFYGSTLLWLVVAFFVYSWVLKLLKIEGTEKLANRVLSYIISIGLLYFITATFFIVVGYYTGADDTVVTVLFGYKGVVLLILGWIFLILPLFVGYFILKSIFKTSGIKVVLAIILAAVLLVAALALNTLSSIAYDMLYGSFINY